MIILIKAMPNSSEQKVIEVIKNKEYIVKLKSRPEKNRANIELINLLSKYFLLNSSKIKIKKGATSKNKIVELEDG